MLFVFLFLVVVVIALICVKAVTELAKHSSNLQPEHWKYGWSDEALQEAHDRWDNSSNDLWKSKELLFLEECFQRTREKNHEHWLGLNTERSSGSQWGTNPCCINDPERLENHSMWWEFTPAVGAMPNCRYFTINNTGNVYPNAKERMTSFGEIKDRQDQLELVNGAHGPELVFKGEFKEKVAEVITVIIGPDGDGDDIVYTWHPGWVAAPFDKEQLTVNDNGSFDAPDSFPVKLS